MKTSLNIAVYGNWTASGQLQLWGILEGAERLAARELKLLLFADDPDRFFGTAVETWERDVLEGVSLAAEDALAFFERPPVNPLAAVVWHSGLDDLRSSASSLRRALRAREIIPCYRSWTEGKLVWTVDPERDPALAEILERSEAVQRLVHGLMLGESRRNGALMDAMDRLLNWQGPRPAERDFLYLIGWLRDEIPFRPALRLMEPNDPLRSQTWRLSFVLSGLDDEETSLLCDAAGRPLQPVPEAWAPYLSHAEAALKLWLQVVPEIARSPDPPLLKEELDDAEAWLFLTDYSRRLAARGGFVLLPAWWQRLRESRPKLRARLRMDESAGEPAIFGVDQVLRFDWKLSVGDVELSEEEFRAITSGRKRLHFVRGQWIWLDDKLAEQIRKIAGKTQRKGGITLKEVLHRHFGGQLADAQDPLPDAPRIDWEITMGPRFARWIRQLVRPKEIPPFAPPAAFRGSLRGYQKEGVAWLLHLRRFGFGACLADDMGLGKTIQYIAYLLKVKEEEPGAGPSLLICPTSLIGNWQKELARFAPELRVHLHYGADRPKDPEPVQGGRKRPRSGAHHLHDRAPGYRRTLRRAVEFPVSG